MSPCTIAVIAYVVLLLLSTGFWFCISTVGNPRGAPLPPYHNDSSRTRAVPQSFVEAAEALVEAIKQDRRPAKETPRTIHAALELIRELNEMKGGV